MFSIFKHCNVNIVEILQTLGSHGAMCSILMELSPDIIVMSAMYK